MANVLQFSLGLTTASFLSAAKGATAALAALTGVGLGVGGVVAGVEKQIARGAGLKDLANRTGVGVAALYGLQQAFKTLGVSADSVPSHILALQRSLGGVNEAGEPTAKIFEQLGLNIDDLKKLDAPAQIEAITKKLAGLDNASAASAAAKIFGRGGAGDMLQIARSGNELGEALQKAAAQGELFARNAEAFERIDKSFASLKGKGDALFSGLAQGIAPALDAALSSLNQIDLSGLGQRLGNTVAGLGEALRVGQFSEVFELALKAGIQGGSDFMLTKIGEWSEAIQKAFGDRKSNNGQHPWWTKAGATAFGTGAGLLGFWDAGGAALGIPGAKGMADKRFAQAQKWFERAGNDNGILARVADAVNAGVAGQPNKFADELRAKMDDLAKAALARTLGVPVPAAPGNPLDVITDASAKGGSAQRGPDVNALERIGFIFGGSRESPATAHARQTATNTAKMIVQLDKVADALARGLPVSFQNIA